MRWATLVAQGVSRTIVAHWVGFWSTDIAPNVGTGNNYLRGVGGVSTSDAWGVGQYYSGTTPLTLIVHYNGTSWSAVSSPNPVGATSSELLGVSAASSTDVWAVGDYNNGTTNRTLIEHWDGTFLVRCLQPQPRFKR